MDEDHELVLAARSRGVDFLRSFLQLYSQDTDMGVKMLFSVYVSCYSLLEDIDRTKSIALFSTMVMDIKNTKFEDPADFLSFVREKQEEGID